MKKRLQVIVSLYSVIITAFTMTSLTLAWINTNQNVSRVTIKTGEGKFELHAGIYDRKVTVTNGTIKTYVDDEPNYAPTLDEANSSNEAIAFNFSQSIAKVTLESLVFNEHAAHAEILPSYVFEMHAHTTLDLSYIRLSISQQTYGLTPNVDYSLYTFQYVIIDNNQASPMDYAAPSKLSTLEEKTKNEFNGETPLYFTEGAGVNNGYTITIAPAEVPFYSEYFAKSILILIRPKPLEFYQLLKDSQLSGTSTKKAGIRFQLYSEFSLVPFGS